MHYFTLAFGLSDIGGGEIMLVGVIALLLFGKDLPVVMRTLGKHYSRIKNTLNDAKSEFTREMDSAAREIEDAKKEVGLDKTLNERISFDDDHPEHNIAPDVSTTPNAPYTLPSPPAESIDQGPESLDKLSAAPLTPVTSAASSTPAPTPAPDAAAVAESPAPTAVATSEPAAPVVDTSKSATPATLDDLEKRIAPPKKIPPPVA